MKIRNLILGFFEKATHGCLKLTLPDGQTSCYGVVEDCEPAELIVHNDAFFRKIALKNDIGLGQSYIDGDWDSPDPASFIAWLVKNKDVFLSSKFSWAMPAVSKLASLQERFAHWSNANSKTGSKRNIKAHYDLGNEFYSQFLDETMTYSSAYFDDSEMSLNEAQEEKYERICQKLNLANRDKVLEIGCGWGGFATYAARKYGCHVTGITLSQKQYDYAVERVRREGLSDSVDIQLIDYRDLDGKFDKIASIEMIEAVGHQHLPTYFSSIDRLLKPTGISCIQVIMSADHRYQQYCKESDFIRKFIFPGSHLPSIASVFEAKGESDLNLYHFESFGLHYATTLEHWRERFEANWDKIKQLGFDEAFRRKWRLYFDYCIAGFKERHINVGQITLGRLNSTEYSYENKNFSVPHTNVNYEKASPVIEKVGA